MSTLLAPSEESHGIQRVVVAQQTFGTNDLTSYFCSFYSLCVCGGGMLVSCGSFSKVLQAYQLGDMEVDSPAGLEAGRRESTRPSSLGPQGPACSLPPYLVGLREEWLYRLCAHGSSSFPLCVSHKDTCPCAQDTGHTQAELRIPCFLTYCICKDSCFPIR